MISIIRNTFQKFSSAAKQYDIVIAGANLGSVLANHLSATTDAKILLCYDNPYIHFYPQRSLYQSGRLVKSDVNLSVKSTMKGNFDCTHGIGINKFRPNTNELILKNGIVVKYSKLVIAMGMKKNIKNIKGYQQSWSDRQQQFYTCRDHYSWGSYMAKTINYTDNFKSGQTIFYIPPRPFFGELENYNFLMSHSAWQSKKTKGQISSDSTFTIVNANNSFSQHSEDIDMYFRKQIDQRGIKLQSKLKLRQVKKNTAIFQDIESGVLSSRVYSSFYSLIPSRPHYRLIQAGLTTHNGFLSVNYQTLRHNIYDNIFGLGDVNDLPTTKTFFGGFQQLNVLRNNLTKILNKQPLCAKYDGHTLAPILTNLNQLQWLKHYYRGTTRSSIFDFFSTNQQYNKYVDVQKSDIKNIYKFKSWGPPLYKHPKIYEGVIEQKPNVNVNKFCEVHPI